MTEKELNTLVDDAISNYRGVDRAKVLRLWKGTLAEYTYDQVRFALKKHMVASKHFPRVSEIVQYIPVSGDGAGTERKSLFSASEKRSGVERNRRTYDEIRAGKYTKDGRPVDLDAMARKYEAERAPRLEEHDETDL